MRRAVRGIAGISACVACMWIAPAPSLAGAEDDPSKQLYLRYCSACHGASGKGDGVVSQLMRPKPTDLTELTKNGGGEFPSLKLMRIIDGRETVRGHGDPDMPVWGEVFKAETGASLNRRAEVEGKVMLITEFVRSIQRK